MKKTSLSLKVKKNWGYDMRILCVGDVHLKETNKELVIQLLDKIAEWVVSKQIEKVIFLGDVYNQRSVVRTGQQRVLVQGMAKILRGGCSVDIVVGNHDYDSLETTDTHSLDVLIWLFKQNSLRVYNQFTQVDDFVFIPYTKNIGGLCELLKNCSAKFAFCHIPVSGFWLTPFHKETKGALPDWFRSFNRVYVGHFHVKQTEGKFVYPGSTFVNSFAEAGMRPSLVIADTETGHEECLDLKNEIPELGLYIVEKIDGVSKFDMTVDVDKYVGNSVRFIITGDTLDDCKLVKEKIASQLRDTVLVQYQYKTLKMTQERMPESMSIEDMFLRYVDSKLFANADPRLKQGMKDVGLKYIESVYADI